MAAALLLGGAIAAGAVYATQTPPEVEEDTDQFLEVRKKGMLDSVVRAQQSISGAPNAFGPFHAPDQTVQSVTQAQKAYARDTSEVILQQAAFNLRGQGNTSRVIVANAGNTIPLMRFLGFDSGGKLGDIKHSEDLRENPLLYGQSENGAIGDQLIDRGRTSGVNIADDHSKRYTSKKKHINSGPTFTDKTNPYTKGGAITQLQQDISSRTRKIPLKGDLTTTIGQSKYVSKPVTSK